MWTVDEQTGALVREELALGEELTLSVRQGTALRLTKYQVSERVSSTATP